MVITVQSGYASEVGRLRPVNQDSALVTGMIFAVADGMGGHAAGEVASRLAEPITGWCSTSATPASIGSSAARWCR